MLYPLLDFLAYDIQGTFQVFHVRGTGDEHLLDSRLRLLCALPQDGRVDRYAPQVHQGKPFTLYFLYHDAQDACLFLLVLGQEDQPCAVLSFFRHRYALQQDKLMRNLYHDAGTVSGLVVGTFRPAVFHILQHFQCRVHQFVRLVAMNVYNHSHTASIVLVCSIV